MRFEGWQKTLAALWLSQALSQVAFNAVFPFVPLYVQEMGVTDSVAAVQWGFFTAAAASICMAITQPLWGHLADRSGRRFVVIVTMLLTGALVVGMGFLVAPEQLLVVRMLHGAAAGTMGAASALVASFIPKEKLGLALGLLQVSFFVGIIVGPTMGGLIADRMGFQPAFLTAGVLVLLGALLVVAVVQESFTPVQSGTSPSIWAGNKALLAVPLAAVAVIIVFITEYGATVVFPVLSIYVKELGAGSNTATLGGLVMGAGGLMGAVSAVIMGRVGDRRGYAPILIVCLIGAAIAYVPQGFVQEIWQLLLLRLLLGTFMGAFIPCCNALLVSVVPSAQRGAALGLSMMAMSVAVAAGPLTGAAIVGGWGLRAVFPFAGALFVLASVWLLVQWKRYGGGMQAAVALADGADRRARQAADQ